MESSPYGFLCNPNLPSEEEIVVLSRKVGLNERGTTITDPSTSSIIAWVKYGPYITIEHARTQDWTAKALRDSRIGDSDIDIQAPRVYHAFTAKIGHATYGYIVMEYIAGEDCQLNEADVELGAKALQVLIGLRAPADATLGHVGGGTKSIVHPFYPEWYCDANYRSDEDFFAHMRNLFKFWPELNFRGNVSGYDRFLCPSDFNSGNFRKRMAEDGRIVVVALDFTATCFMPLPFIELALEKARQPFAQLVAKKITFPQGRSDPKLVHALSIISGCIVPYGKTVALPRGVTHRVPGSRNP